MLKAKTNGFTIVELLIVIVVIGILAAITIVAYNGMQTRSRNTIRISDLRSMQKMVEIYKASEGTYPNTSDGWRGLCAVFGSNPAYIPGLEPYVSSPLPIDPRWKQPSDDKCYLYRSNGTDYAILAWVTFESGCGTGDPGDSCNSADVRAHERCPGTPSMVEASLAVYSTATYSC